MSRRILLMTIAVVLALAGTLAVYKYVKGADNRAVAGQRAASVLVVEKRVPAGTKWSDVVSGHYLQQENVPVDSAPSSAIRNLQAKVDPTQVATADIQTGQIVLRPMFGPKTIETGVLQIPGDKVALTVSMSSGADVAGFVAPQSEVAVFGTFKLKPIGKSKSSLHGLTAGDDMYATKLVLSRATVIATSQAAPTDVTTAAKSNGSADDILVTLAVSQADAERVILAQQTGQLYLALLSSHSKTGPDGGTVNVSRFNPVPIFTG